MTTGDTLLHAVPRVALAAILLAWALALAAVLPAQARVFPGSIASGGGAVGAQLKAASMPATLPPAIDASGTPTPSPSPAPSGSGSGSTGDPVLRGIILMLIVATIGLIGMRYIERRILRS